MTADHPAPGSRSYVITLEWTDDAGLHQATIHGLWRPSPQNADQDAQAAIHAAACAMLAAPATTARTVSFQLR